MALTAKQTAFVQEYLVDLNATQAAIRAGYSQRRAGEIGYQLLQKTTVQEAIKAAMDERGDRTHITQDFVLAELYKIATQGADDGPESSLKYSNKLKALELLGKHMAMFTERSEVTGTLSLTMESYLEDLDKQGEGQAF
ncbi:terminase small subunit [Flavonifractor sp. An9]|uniref:terminase small subunit n=1 Tax=Flavonifractor sp. An9 TaxID=1965664 RepID=UPI000B3894BC|nr:terminase small subunit [Flavonifractor sp. An9]OUN09805.1 hypothetical protein B5G40_11855 [Flavonifractor sp. An9]